MDTRVDYQDQISDTRAPGPPAGLHTLVGGDLLDQATDGLKHRAPQYSAATPVFLWQKLVLIASVFCAAAGLYLAPSHAVPLLFALLSVPFFFVVLVRIVALAHVTTNAMAKPDVAAPISNDDHLPTYAILVPLYREAHVVPGLIEALDSLDYPKNKLQIALIVEAVDKETPKALRAMALPKHMRFVTVPDGLPRTKPRALNYALQSTFGDYVVVYDAEDFPERNQLRCAVAALRSTPEKLGCVQARLSIDNPKSSWLTRQFTIEYTVLFDAILPTLQVLDLPVPLGGTSNHFPRAVLEQVGGWDPYNVTEDADLGIRLSRFGWRVGVLKQRTEEEAPASYRVWRGQRTRWLKGWMQTYLVHMRYPRKLWSSIGLYRFIGFQILMGGLLLSAIVHPWFYVLLVYAVFEGQVLQQLMREHTSAAASVLFWLGVFNLVGGYVSAMVLGALTVNARGMRWLGWHVLTMPVYWLMISLMAYRALWQLVFTPFEWEKTDHVPRPGSCPRAKGPPDD